MEEQITLQEGTVIDGRYELQQVLGMGGVGVVYQAQDLKLRRTVALKLLKPEFAEHETLRPRFEREAETMASLMHPNLVMVLDYGLQQGTPYIVMELLHGRTLRATMDEAPMSEALARDTVLQLLQGLSYAHQRGIAHRDIKPGNILLQTHPNMGQQVKILDFGFAKILTEVADAPSDGAVLTVAGTAFGTPTYMAPEQVTVGNMDARTDVYAVGVMLYEMLAGVPPFQGGLSELLRKHLIAEVPPINVCCPGAKASSDFEALLKKSMAKKPDDRYENAATLATALEQLPKPWMLQERVALAWPVSGQAKTMLLDSVDLLSPQSSAALSPPSKGAPDDDGDGEVPTAMFVAKPAAPAMSRHEATQTIRSGDWKSPVIAFLSNLGQHVRDVEQRLSLRARASSLARQGRTALPAAVAKHVDRMRAASAPFVARAIQLTKDNPSLRYAAVGATLALVIVITYGLTKSTDSISIDAQAKPQAQHSEPARSASSLSPSSALWTPEGTSQELLTLRDLVKAGRELDKEQLEALRRLAAADREDPRPHLVLAATYMQRGWRPDALKAYQQAYKANRRANEDPHMLVDLVALREHRKVGRVAQQLLTQAYGRSITDAVDEALGNEDLADEDKVRLEELKQSLAQAK